MSEYVPTTSEAQSYYVAGRAQLRRQVTGEQAIDITPYSHEFDRMITEVRAEAWSQGADAAVEGYDLPDAAQIFNPYRTTNGEE